MDGIDGTIENVLLLQVKSGQIIINSAEDFVRLPTGFAFQSPSFFKSQMLSLVNLVISKKHQSY